MGETDTLVDLFADIRDPTMDEPEMKLSHMLAQCINRLKTFFKKIFVSLLY